MSAEAATAEPKIDTNAIVASLASAFSEIGASLKKSLEPLEKVAEKIGGSKFGKNAKAFGSAMKELGASNIAAWKLEQLMKLIEPFMDLLKLFEIPIGVLAGMLQMFVNEIFVQLLPMFLEFSTLLLQLAPIFQQLGSLVGGVLAVAFQVIMDLINMLIPIIMPLIDMLMAILVPILEALFRIFMQIWEILKPLVNDVLSLLMPYFDMLLSIMMALLPIIILLIEKGLSILISVIGSILDIIKPVVTFLKAIFLPIWDNIKVAFDAIKIAWADSGGKLFGKGGFIDLAFGVLKKAWDDTGALLFGEDGIIGSAFEALLEFGKGIANWFISAINNLFGIINKIPGVDIATIPLLAQGGIVTAPTLAMIGEGGQPEAVIPLDRLGEMTNNAALLAATEETNRLMSLLVKQNGDVARFTGFG